MLGNEAHAMEAIPAMQAFLPTLLVLVPLAVYCWKGLQGARSRALPDGGRGGGAAAVHRTRGARALPNWGHTFTWQGPARALPSNMRS